MILLKLFIPLMFTNIFASYNQVEAPISTQKTYTVSGIPKIEIPEIPITQVSFEDTEEEEPRRRRVKRKSSKESDNPTSSTSAEAIVQDARQYVGQPYTWGGKSPESGFDCSGLISHVFKNAGYNIGSSTAQLFTAGKAVSLDDARVGDIICSKGSGPTGRHVKLISKIDNGQIYTIEAKGRKWGIVESPLKKTSNIVSVRRVV